VWSLRPIYWFLNAGHPSVNLTFDTARGRKSVFDDVLPTRGAVDIVAPEQMIRVLDGVDDRRLKPAPDRSIDGRRSAGCGKESPTNCVGVFLGAASVSPSGDWRALDADFHPSPCGTLWFGSARLGAVR